jgi:hypothetical protein
MDLFRKVAPTSAIIILYLTASAPCLAQAGAQVERVRILNAGPKVVEIEIASNQPITPRTQEVSDPTRLVIDFPQAIPGPQLRALGVNRAEVKGVRVGLFSAQPPTTRVVFDLNGPINYQVFPSGKTVIVKLGESVTPTPAADSEAPPAPPAPKVAVTFQNGLLSIHSDRASLAEVLNEIHNRTGAEIAVPAGAEREPAFVDLGPAPAKEVLSALLDGSPYNFILIGSSSNPTVLERVLLSSKGTSMGVEVGGGPEIVTAEPPSSPPPPQVLGATRMIPSARPSGQPQPVSDEMPPDDEPQPGDPQVNGQAPPQN